MPIISLLALPLLAARLTTDGPWTKVPPLPTSCYSDADTSWYAAVAKHGDGLHQQIRAQEEANRVVLQAFKDQEVEARGVALQAARKKDPKGVAKVEKAVQAAGGEASLSVSATLPERNAQFRQQFTVLEADYQTALAAIPDSAYAKLCKQWFRAGGKFPKWLAGYRTFLVKERVPAEEQHFATGKSMLTYYGINTTDYRSPAALQAVVEYMGLVVQMSYERRARP